MTKSQKVLAMVANADYLARRIARDHPETPPDSPQVPRSRSGAYPGGGAGGLPRAWGRYNSS
jgi:hypothetical protein